MASNLGDLSTPTSEKEEGRMPDMTKIGEYCVPMDPMDEDGMRCDSCE